MSLKISRILHAGYVFESDQTQIAFDPIFENPFSRNCYAFPNIEFDLEQIRELRFSAVFISHYHDDHCSLESLDLLDRNTPIYLYCVFEELFSLIKELGFIHVHSLKINVPVQVGPFEIFPRKALDVDVDSMFQIKASGFNVLNVVDSWIDFDTVGELAAKGPWDMILWPFQTMREIDVLCPSRAPKASTELPAEWIEQLQSLNPKYIVPSSCQFIQESWSWYNHAMFPITYRQFEQQMKAALPNSEIVRLNPSTSVTFTKNGLQKSIPLNWIRPLGSQEVDYDFIENIKTPTTAEIAHHFPPLDSSQVERVYKYCRTGLVEKYKSLYPPNDKYFDKQVIWQLALYFSNGDWEKFFYRIENNILTPIEKWDGPISWATEVPVSKLYAALELGESLTSMYVRINDFKFENGIEQAVQLADIMEDPLIRCLFNGTFGAYQKYQLKKIRNRGKQNGGQY